ncbi:hypothetical protein C6P44_000609 [Monosporozyma unispora]|nr:hypothetical protein C6P44_000609 [Kazachstania unispora]
MKPYLLLRPMITQLYSRQLNGRTFHTISIQQDFMSWFRSKKQAQAKVRKTKEIIEDIESGKELDESTTESSSKILKLDLTPDNIIGTRRVETINLDDIPWNNWLSSKKVKTSEELDQVITIACKATLGGSISETEPFSDLVTKFNFVKKLQSLSGYTIPDYELTVSNTPAQFKTYYMNNIISGKLQQFNEKEPNAIYLTQDSFKEPNIRVTDRVISKSQEQKFNSILLEVQALKEKDTMNEIQRLRSEE